MAFDEDIWGSGGLKLVTVNSIQILEEVQELVWIMRRRHKPVAECI